MRYKQNVILISSKKEKKEEVIFWQLDHWQTWTECCHARTHRDDGWCMAWHGMEVAWLVDKRRQRKGRDRFDGSSGWRRVQLQLQLQLDKAEADRAARDGFELWPVARLLHGAWRDTNYLLCIRARAGAGLRLSRRLSLACIRRSSREGTWRFCALVTLLPLQCGALLQGCSQCSTLVSILVYHISKIMMWHHN